MSSTHHQPQERQTVGNSGTLCILYVCFVCVSTSSLLSFRVPSVTSLLCLARSHLCCEGARKPTFCCYLYCVLTVHICLACNPASFRSNATPSQAFFVYPPPHQRQRHAMTRHDPPISNISRCFFYGPMLSRGCFGVSPEFLQNTPWVPP